VFDGYLFLTSNHYFDSLPAMSRFHPPVLIIEQSKQGEAEAFYKAVFPEWPSKIQTSLQTPGMTMPPFWQLGPWDHEHEFPNDSGSPNWVEYMTHLEAEESMGRCSVLGTKWRLQTGIPFPIPGQNAQGNYITIFDGSDSLENSHKICGVVPAAALLPDDVLAARTLPLTFVYFAASSKDDIDVKSDRVVKAGGTVVKPCFEGDGWAAILLDNVGALFGLYYPTYVPDQVKPDTTLMTPWNMQPIAIEPPQQKP
jgi:hypothetical protein